ncbi:MAG TPA: tetratricopeptide repeat protein, partial [Candidatus Polarisedimenticolia bacterium]|nr:tetratricopeptide repeat protein [Candidatus Polarisedimenticolia bacterium]
RRGEALELYGRAIELMPDLGWHYYLGAGGPMEPDLFETAREGLMRALQTNVVFRREKIESNLGYLHERQRDFEGALRHYRRAIQIAVDKSQYLYQAGTIFAFQGRTDEAIEYYRRALDKGTLNRRLELAALRQLGRALAERGEHKAAAGYLARARELDPGSYQTRVELGRAWFDAGEISRAESELKNAVQVDPSRPEAYAALISLYRSSGDFARAIPLARRLVEIQPQDRGWKDLLDELYRQVGPDPPGGS